MNRSRILLGIVVIVAVIGAFFLFFITRTAKPLTYRDKSIDYWFTQLPVTPVPPPSIDLGNVQGFVKSVGQQYGGTNLTDHASLDALKAFETNALPFLLARLQGVDSVAEKQITAVATNAGVAYLPFRKAELERLQAVTGLIHVTLTPEVRQLIVALRTNINSDIAAAAAYVLKRRAALGDSASADSIRSAEQGAAANRR